MKKIIDVSSYETNLRILERAYLEITGRENVVNYMVVSGQANGEHYKSFWEEYIYYLKAYEIIKKDFIDNCINEILGYNFIGEWKIDFEAKEVTLYELDD